VNDSNLLLKANSGMVGGDKSGSILPRAEEAVSDECTTTPFDRTLKQATPPQYGILFLSAHDRSSELDLRDMCLRYPTANRSFIAPETGILLLN